MKIVNKTELSNEMVQTFIAEMELRERVAEVAEVKFRPSAIGIAFVEVCVNAEANGVTLLEGEDFDHFGCITFIGYRVARLLGDWANMAYEV
jgi:hypothetical protein